MRCRHRSSKVKMTTGLAALLLALTGCGGTTSNPTSNEAADSDPADEKGATFLGSGKADNATVSPGTPEAKGVLEVANEATFVELDEDASLDRRAAENIVNHRTGSDRTPNTSDDNPIETLEELDGIAWVGPVAVSQLLKYAKRNGYVENANAEIHGIAVGSDEATGVLDVANELSKQQLDDAVALDVRAAEHIVDYRRGRDGTSGTEDDRTFEKLAELDQVSWIEQRAFDKLLSYAKENRYVPVDHWRDLFETGRVDVTFVKTEQSCHVRSCYNLNFGDSGCSEYNPDSWHGSAPNFRVTGQNPGTLKIEYTGEHDSTNEETTFEATIGGDGSFTVGKGDGYHNTTAEFEQYFTGQFENDYEHTVKYHRYFERPSDKEEANCTATYQRKSTVN